MGGGAKRLLESDWGTKLFANLFTGVRNIKKTSAFCFFPKRVIFQHVLLHQSPKSSLPTRLVY